ncbi:MAG TPA: putative porin [Flavipsychrobacter sp.]|nr:putative porin [Flavipsychrobacter sp.]
MKVKAWFPYLLLVFLCLLLCSKPAFAQSTLSGGAPGQPTTLTNAPQRDTNANKSNTSKWKDQEAHISFRRLNSEQTYTPDTSLHTFHRRSFTQPWYQDLGNLGSPAQNLLFTPEDRLGPTLGYHVFDIYRFLPDSLKYYNTTRPYTAFTYSLGSKLEQMAEVMHTQNIRPNWNFSFQYRKINAQGFYKIQRVNDDNANLTTNYQSKDKHYQLFGALIYNKQQQDENGGIFDASQLDSSQYSDRKTIPVAFENDIYSTLRSSVTNMQRDFTMLIQHSYVWGKGDTLYNEDSTRYTYKLTPRFSITHKFELSTEKHEYKDLSPDSFRYASLFQYSFIGANPIAGQGGDSVLSQQKWVWIDNRILFNGFLGTNDKQVEFSAGAGNRIDNFITSYATGFSRDNILSNYLIGELKKEALQPGQFSYQANAQFFLTGEDAGDFLLHASAGKDFKGGWGNIVAGFQQQLNNAPYNYTIYENQYFTYIPSTFNKESITQVYAQLSSPRLRLSGGIRNYLVDNYIYLDQTQKFLQDKNPFNVTEIWARKEFRLGNFILDNELAYQQPTGGAPINVPALLGRHQLSYEAALFKRALKIATGVEIRYTTAYYAAGYNPFFNRFYYQNTYYLGNNPQASVFFSFRIKRFRAFVMGDQLQQLFGPNLVTAPGYPAQDAMIRFGFTWVMIN